MMGLEFMTVIGKN